MMVADPSLHLPVHQQGLLRCAALRDGVRGQGLRGHCVWQAPRAGGHGRGCSEQLRHRLREAEEAGEEEVVV